jgi:hypothetical protein
LREKTRNNDWNRITSGGSVDLPGSPPSPDRLPSFINLKSAEVEPYQISLASEEKPLLKNPGYIRRN